MAFTMDIECHGSNHQGKGQVSTVTGKASTGCADANQANPPFRFVILPSEAGAMGVAPGIYERTSTNSSGQPVYAPANRNH
jgi:hypothetical protein